MQQAEEHPVAPAAAIRSCSAPPKFDSSALFLYQVRIFWCIKYGLSRRTINLRETLTRASCPSGWIKSTTSSTSFTNSSSRRWRITKMAQVARGAGRWAQKDPPVCLRWREALVKRDKCLNRSLHRMSMSCTFNLRKNKYLTFINRLLQICLNNKWSLALRPKWVVTPVMRPTRRGGSSNHLKVEATPILLMEGTPPQLERLWSRLL